jgi:hypothetical protein
MLLFIFIYFYLLFILFLCTFILFFLYFFLYFYHSLSCLYYFILYYFILFYYYFLKKLGSILKAVSSTYDQNIAEAAFLNIGAQKVYLLSQNITYTYTGWIASVCFFICGWPKMKVYISLIVLKSMVLYTNEKKVLVKCQIFFLYIFICKFFFTFH